MKVGESDTLNGDGVEGEKVEEIREEGGADDGALVSGELGGQSGEDEVGCSSRESDSGGEVESRRYLRLLSGEDREGLDGGSVVDRGEDGLVEEGERDGDDLEVNEDLKSVDEEAALDGSSVRGDCSLAFVDDEVPV